ncbi:RNA polymerase sigma factor [Parapedobacter sp. 2B3]|uniref:RNA polymerase sigma factor n=1 Tax=Parapedobacter sp. 2B3 TaxID=3342381 RepID=UPI0035B679E9
MMKKHLPEPALCRRLIDGDERAFREVFDRFHRKIFQFAFNFIKDKAQAEEIVQHTFLNFWLHRDRLDPTKPIAPLLFTIARRTLVDAWRKAASSKEYREYALKAMEPISNETEEKVLLGDLERITQEALDLLNEQQRQVFRLSRNEELSYEEIAERLGLSKHTVKYHLVNALKILKAHLRKHDIHYLFVVYSLFNQLP